MLIMHRTHHPHKTMNLWVLTCVQKERYLDPKNLFLLIFTSVKSLERNWRINIQSGLQMKSWGMSAINGSIWIANKKSHIIKWQLKINRDMINSFQSSHKCLKLQENMSLTSGDLEDLSITVKIKAIQGMIFTILTWSVQNQRRKIQIRKIQQSIKHLNTRIIWTYITLRISSPYHKEVP